MKKISAILIVISLLMVSGVCNAGRQRVLNTDIKAYIDGHPIRSFNIEGWTGIIAEDLADYGFDVTWDNVARTLKVEKGVLKEVISSTYRFEENTVPVGSYAADIYETDIRTFVGTNPVTAFNIGGQTIIYIDELALFGDVVWNSEMREISYSSQKPWSITLPLSATDAAHTGDDGIDGVFAQFVKNADGGFDAAGKNLEHFSWMTLAYNKSYGGLQLGFSVAAEHLFADAEFIELCADICTENYDGSRLREDAELANRFANVKINGQSVKITNVRKEKGNNHLDFIFELASAAKQEEIEQISFEIGLIVEE